MSEGINFGFPVVHHNVHKQSYPEDKLMVVASQICPAQADPDGCDHHGYG